MNNSLLVCVQIIQSTQNLLYMLTDDSLLHRTDLLHYGDKTVGHKLHKDRSLLVNLVFCAAKVFYNIRVVKSF